MLGHSPIAASPIAASGVSIALFTGTLVASAASVSGALAVQNYAAGALLAQNSALAGSVSTRAALSGSLVPASATLASTLSNIAKVSGTLASSSATVTGALTATLHVSGTFSAQAATLSATLYLDKLLTGALASSAASMSATLSNLGVVRSATAALAANSASFSATLLNLGVLTGYYSLGMHQSGTYWPPATPDGFGKITYDAPVTITCRWQDQAVTYKTQDGKTAVSTAVVYVDRLVEPDGVIMLGSSDSDDPLTEESGAYEIKQVNQSPSLDNSRVLVKAIL